MIDEINTPLVTPVMRWLIRRVLIQGAVQRAFHAVRLRVEGDLTQLGTRADPPVILIFSNHVSWWDAYLWDIFNTRLLRVEPIVMAEQRTVRNYGFFRHLGLFSVDRLNPRAAVEAIRHAVKRAIATQRAGVFIFPQGEFRPFEQRPLGFFGGAGRIVADIVSAKGACVLLPLAMRLEFVRQVPQHTRRLAENRAPLRTEQPLVDIGHRSSGGGHCAERTKPGARCEVNQAARNRISARITPSLFETGHHSPELPNSRRTQGDD